MQHIRTFFILFFYFSFLNNSFSQSTNLVFLGTVSVSGGDTYPYKLFVNDSDNILTGYSVTDINGTNETKTAIRGNVNPNKKQVTFTETKIISTKSKLGPDDFCYIHARLKTGEMQGASTLKGSFAGYKNDGVTECGKGKIMLVCAQDLLDKLMKIADKNNIERPDTAKKDTTGREAPATSPYLGKIQSVQPGKTVDITCSTAVILLEIWDAKNPDNDIITLMQDSKVLLDNYTITAAHKTVNLDMGDSKTLNLRLIAISEGSDPTNTARIRITSGKDVYYIDATTVMGKDVQIHLVRK